MSLNYEIEITASLRLDEHWLDDDAIEGLTLAEIKKLSKELIEEDFGEFCERAEWNVSVEYKPKKKHVA